VCLAAVKLDGEAALMFVPENLKKAELHEIAARHGMNDSEDTDGF